MQLAIVEGLNVPRVFGVIPLIAGIYKKKQSIKLSQENKFHKVKKYCQCQAPSGSRINSMQASSQ